MKNDEDISIEQDGSEEIGASESELDEMESKADGKLAKLKAELEACRKERQEYLDGWQRAKADYVNVLKRGDEEREAAKQKGVVKAAQAFIGVIDTLKRAEAAGEVPDAFKAVAKQLHDAAHSLGLTEFGATGEAFDPMLHEALGQDVAVSKDEDDTVSVVLETGWKAGDTVIRPAKVRVAQYQ